MEECKTIPLVATTATAEESRTSSLEQVTSEDAQALADALRDEHVIPELIKEYQAMLRQSRRLLKETEGLPDRAALDTRKMAVADRQYALRGLQGLLSVALLRTSKKSITGETKSATAISKEQLRELELLPADARDEIAAILNSGQGRIRELITKHGRIVKD